MLIRQKLVMFLVMCSASNVLVVSLHASEVERETFFLSFLNCVMSGEPSDEFGQMFGLERGQMQQGFLGYIPNATYSESELNAFKWRNRLPPACLANILPDERLANYVVDQTLAITGAATGVAITWEEVASVDSTAACADARALGDDGKEDTLEPALDLIMEELKTHPVLGDNVAPDGIHEQEILWRAYWVGRWRDRELNSDALQNYLVAFEDFPEERQRHEEITLNTPLALFDRTNETSDQRLQAFGPISWGGIEGLDMASYIGRQQIWNYILSGETEFPVPPIYIDEAQMWQPEVIAYLGGGKPGPEESLCVNIQSNSS